MSHAVRAVLVADFTVGALAPFLRSLDDLPAIDSTLGPFGQVTSVLLDEAHPCWRGGPDLLVVWTRPESAIPAFGRLIDGEAVPLDEALADVDRFCQMIRAAASRVGMVFAPTWTFPAYHRGLGVLNMDAVDGPGYFLLRMNARLIESLRPSRNVRVLDAGRWVAQAGPAAASSKLWHLGKIAFGPEVLRLAAADIKAGIRASRGEARKLIVVDLDDTLWGGVVGDVGWENLILGGHHPVGESFRAFQRGLRTLARRGIALGIVSKNTEAVALEAIDCHPEMLLRRNDFAAWRINWSDKADNVASLAAELQLGLQSVVFIDDNPAERERVRTALPDVLVPEWPADKLLYEQALGSLACFDFAALTEEDRGRTRSYASRRDREPAPSSPEALDAYLRSLELTVIAEALGPANIVRAAQLLNKTNQMNLATRRLTEDELLAWAARAGRFVFVFRVADRFEDYGLTGLASLALDGGTASVTDFVVSCRVMGRGVEQAMLYSLISRARALDADRVDATCIPTARNAPCLAFFDRQSQFTRAADGPRYSWDLLRSYAPPVHVAIEFHDDAGVTEPCGRPS